MKATEAWLDAKPGRRARYAAKARRRNLSGLPEQFGGTSKAIVQRGTQLRTSGVGTLIAGGVLNGIAVGVSPVAPGVGIGSTSRAGRPSRPEPCSRREARR